MKNIRLDTASLAETVGFELVGAQLGRDIDHAINAALKYGVVFPKQGSPLSIFREALATSIRAIETHHREPLFQNFLLKGPYENSGPIPKKLIGYRLSDDEVASVIKFIYSYMVNCFKGAVTELLATNACARLLKQLQQNNELPANIGLYAGDVVGIHQSNAKSLLKGADLHVLIEDHDVVVAGVAEVKSYFASECQIRKQLDRHINRSRQGLRIAGKDYPGERVRVGFGPSRRVQRIMVFPGNWRLPRTYHFENSTTGRMLHIDPGVPFQENDQIVMTGDAEWRITLRWSKEALSEAAYEMTFWYMEKVGEIIYSRSKPKGWEDMSASEAGRNAAKMMLYYAILRCRTNRETQRAIALYNTYGFGYALGMNFKNAQGKREMLWPKDLDEILACGRTKNGCRIY